MNRKKSILSLLLIILLTAFLGVTLIFGLDGGHTGSVRNIKTGLDLSGGVSITYETVEKSPSQKDMDDTIYKLKQRVESYSTEANVYQQGENRINVEIPGATNANEILEDLGKPGSLFLVDEKGNVVLVGTDIANAEGAVSEDTQTGKREYIVELTLTSSGTEKFAEATSESIGKKIYIVYDGAVISAPTVQSAITDGRAQISGMSDLEDAKALASNIRIGALNLELNEIYSNVVGAQLGQNALETSLMAGAIGIAFIILLMIICFRVSGIAAGWALILFTMLDLLAINAFDITLTLPGIAGVILTIGMAVDANIIIYTRTKEELGKGSSVRSAIESGFKKTFWAIFDGNVTTLIAAVVLFAFGSGSVKGFAETLAVGVLASMFSALVLSRWISEAFVGIGLNRPAMYGKKKQREPMNFVGKRALTFALAIIMILAAPAGMAYNEYQTGAKFNYSLDFIGGTATTVEFASEMSLEDLDNKVKPVVSEITGNDIQFQKISGSNEVVIKTQELDTEHREQLNEALEENFDVVENSITAENISSVISNEMKTNATKAVIIAVICMLLYIWIRFRNIRFASSAIIALIHDVFVVIAFYVWFKASVGSTFIAVMLTILGYSVNSTIVIFDRIREYKNSGTRNEKDMVNKAVTDTLSRSILSTLTTFVTVFILYLMSVPAVKEFALPIMIGLVAGMFSSVCVTGPLWYTVNNPDRTHGHGRGL